MAGDAAHPYRHRVESYEQALSVCPGDPELYRDLALLLLEHYDYDLALRWLDRGLRIAPDDADLKLYRAAALLLLNRPREALSILQRLSPSPRAKFYLGLVHRALKEHRAAQRDLIQAWELGYADPYLLYALLGEDRALTDQEALSEHFQILNSKFPNSPWLHMALGDTLKSGRRNADAESEYQKAEQMEPNLPLLHYQLGYFAFLRGDYALASEHFRKELRVTPSHAEACLYLGITLHRQGRNPEALPYLERAVIIAPGSPLAYRELGAVQIETNQLEKALGTLQSAKEKFPKLAAFPAELSRLLRRMGRPEEATAEATLAQRLSQKRVEAEQELSGIE